MMLPAELIAEMKQRRVLLFAGAGLSATLGLPNWSGLIDKMATDLDFDPELFKMLGDFPSLAEYYLLEKPDRAELGDWLRRSWHNSSIDVAASKAHAAILDARFPIIYTTNYDHWIERAYAIRGIPISKIVHGDDIADVVVGDAQVVKFHGDLDHPETMVLTEADYFERLRFDSELDLKLQSDLLQYSILFVGYSLTDLNMRNMLYRLSLFHKKHASRRKNLRRSYIFLDRRNEVQTAIFERWGIDTITSEKLDRRDGLTEFLATLAAACL